MKTSRRTFLKAGAVAGAGMLLPIRWGPSTARAASPSITKYVDALPVPRSLVTASGGTYNLSMVQSAHKFHRDLGPAQIWTYTEGAAPTYLGPTFETRTGAPINVNWTNNLPTTHLFAASIDQTLNSMMMMPGVPDVRTVVHLHGGFTHPDSDGNPMAWDVPGGTANYHYTNLQPATMLWYHDHAMGITRLNVFAGLTGLYLIRDAAEDALNIPRGAFEVPLIIQDRTFNPDGTLAYPTMGVTTEHPIWMPEFFGDVAVVNGKAWPFLNVEPRRYRFRVLNATQARFLNLWIDNNQKIVPVWQIGSDGGLLQAPVQLDKLLLGPAERADIIVDFTALKGKTLTMLNNAKAPFPGAAGGFPQIMQIRVGRTVTGPDTTTPPANLGVLNTIAPIPQAGAVVRDLSLIEFASPLNGEPTHALIENSFFNDPVTVTPTAGATEIWRLLNTTGDAHPIHVHLVQFQILDRTAFDVAKYMANGQVVTKGPAAPPPANEAGWKDTVRTMPGEMTRIIAKFDLPPGVTTPAEYMLHCHILEHEDNEMMRPFHVV